MNHILKSTISIPKSIYRWCTKTRLRKILSSFLTVLILLTSIKYLFISPKPVLADSLLGFNEGYGTTVSDANGNTSGTITGATWRTSDLCYSGNCLYFDGSDWINFGDDDDLDFIAATDFTIQFWFRHGTASATEVILQKYEGTGGDGGYRIQMESDGDISFGVDDANEGFVDDNITSTSANYDDNNWHFVSAVKDGTTGIYLYIDGVQVANDTTIGSTGTLVNDDTLYIGDSTGVDGGDEYIGFLDEVKIYTTAARTQTEINADKLGATPDRGSSVSFGPDNSYLSNGLVGYWPLDNTTDYSGNGTTLTNNSSTPFTTAKFGNSSEHDGTTDYFEAADNATLSITGNLTLSAWINNDDTTGSQNIVGKWDGTNNSYLLALEGDELRMYIASSSNHQTTTAANLGSNTFIHVAGVYNSVRQTVTLFVNGIEQASTTTGGTIPASIGDDTGELVIGADDSPANYFDGHIDDVRIYNRTLLSNDISRLYNHTLGPSGYWKVDENSGSTANDSSGNGNAGTIVNTPEWTIGKFGNALKFNGTNEYITLSDSGSLSITGDLTISAWIKPNATAASTIYSIAGKWQTGDTAYVLIQYEDEIRLYLGAVTNYVSTTAANLVTGTFYHISAVYSATNQTVSIYINGIAQATSTTGSIPSSLTDGAQAFTIATSALPNNATLNYNVAAAADDAHEQYNNTNYSGTGAYVTINSNTTQANSRIGGFRFSSVNIPQGTTISSAYMEVFTDIANDDADWTVFAEDVDNSANFTTTADVANRYLNTATTASAGPYSGTNLINTWFGSAVDISAVIQEIVDRPGWTAGNALTLLARGNTSTTRAYSATAVENGTEPTRLHISYGVPSYYNGTIDEVKVYNYTRSVNQIVEDMNGGHPAPGSPISSAVAKWRFDEGALNTCSGGVNDFCDASGNGNDLAFSTTTGGHTNSGKFGKAFNGATNLRASITDNPDFDFAAGESLTFSLWFRSDSATNPSANEYLLEKGGNIATDAIGYAVYTSAASDGLICFGIDDDATAFPEDSVCSSADYYDATWHHLVVKKTADSSLDLYIDGLPNGTPDTTISATGTLENAATFYIGDTNATDGTDEFLGDIDEVHIFRSALTQDQIYGLYNQGASANMGATGTDSSGNATWSSDNEYCPPGQGSACTPPVGHWKLDENTSTSAYDISAHGYTGTLTGSPLWTPAKIATGLSTSINAVQQYVTVADPASGDLDFTGSDDFTLETWVKFTSVEGAYTPIIQKNFNGNPAVAGYTLGVSPAGGTYPLICYYSDGSGGTTDGNTGAYTGSLNDGQWHHLACVMDRDGSEWGTTGYLAIIDGIVVDADTSLTEGSSANTGALILGEFDAAAEIGDGTIDDFRIYKYARTPTQIAWDMTKGKPTTWLKFDENTGSPTTLNDASGNGNNGTAAGTMDSADWLDGKYNASLDFDGSDDVVSIANSTTVDLNAGLGGGFSFSAWIYPNTVGETAGRIFQKGTNGSTTDSSTTYCRVEGSTPFDITCRVDLATADADFTVSGAAPANQWSHVVFTWNNDSDDEVTIWINGIASTSTASFSGNTTAEANSLYIAGNGTTNTRAFDGQIDDFRVYNYELTKQQVQTLMNDGAVNRFGPETGSP